MTNQKKTRGNKNYKNQSNKSEKTESNSSKDDINSKKETKAETNNINSSNSKNTNSKITNLKDTDIKKEEQKAEVKKTKPEIKAKQDTGQNTKQDTKQNAKQEVKQSITKQPKKQGKGAIMLALLLGATGTAIATYTFTQTRDITNSQNLVKDEVTSTLNNLKAEIAKSSKTTSSGKTDSKTIKNIAEIKQQMEQISNKLNSLNSKVVEIEQIQAGVTNKVQETVTELMKAENEKISTLTAKLNELELGQKGLVNNFSASTNSEGVTIDTTKFDEQVKNLANKITELELGQKGLANNFSASTNTENKIDTTKFDEQIQALVSKISELEIKQATQAQELATSKAESSKETKETVSVKITLQEVGYSLALASKKLKQEADIKSVTKAIDLLKSADKKISTLETEAFNQVREDIAAKLIRLQGVSPINYKSLAGQLKSISGLLTDLKIKSNNPNPKTVKEDDTIMGKVMGAIKSNVKITPSDSKAITEKTASLQKRFILADLRTAELAIKLKDKQMLLTSISSIKASLKNTFANDNIQEKITTTLKDLETIDLNLTLPDLSSVVSKFEESLNKYNNQKQEN